MRWHHGPLIRNIWPPSAPTYSRLAAWSTCQEAIYSYSERLEYEMPRHLGVTSSQLMTSRHDVIHCSSSSQTAIYFPFHLLLLSKSPLSPTLTVGKSFSRGGGQCPEAAAHRTDRIVSARKNLT